MNVSAKTYAHFAIALLLVLTVVSACSDERDRSPDVEFLSSDAHFDIGGHHIIVPVVALRGPDHVFTLERKSPKSRKEILETQASDPDNPMRVDRLDLAIRQYRYTGEHAASVKICPRLKRLWAQLVCRGEHNGILKRLPEKFDLVDRAKLDLLKNHWTVGGERQYDQIKDMPLRHGVTEIGCDKASRFCTAAVEVLPGLLAVWTVWSDEREPATQMAETQGSAIVEFVHRAIGPIEDKTLASAE